jgi:hypothetical protein
MTEKEHFIEELKSLFFNTKQSYTIGYYCLCLHHLFRQERDKLSNTIIEDNFNIIESYYESFSDDELIAEAYAGYIKLLMWAHKYGQKNINEDGNKHPLLKRSVGYYFTVLHSLANKYPQNHDVVQAFLDNCEDMIESSNDTKFLNDMYDSAVTFSKRYPDDFGDISYDCNNILKALYKKFTDNQKKNDCLREMKRIVDSCYDERSHWVTDLFEELYDDAETHLEKEKYMKLLIDYYNENPWNTEISWKYVNILNCTLQNTDDLGEKSRLFSIIVDWLVRQPGNFYILEEYADSLLNITYSTINNSEFTVYKDNFLMLHEKFPSVIEQVKMNKKKEYDKILNH